MTMARFARRGVAFKDAQQCQDASTLKAIRNYIRGRRIRSNILGADLFADPAWDMLLELYASEAEGRRISANGLCACSGVAQTTALRWLRRLEEAGLVTRVADEADGRRSWIDLTDRGRTGVRTCITYAIAQQDGAAVEAAALHRLGIEVVRDQLARDCLHALHTGQAKKAESLCSISAQLVPVMDAAAFQQAYDAVLRSLFDGPVCPRS